MSIIKFVILRLEVISLFLVEFGVCVLVVGVFVVFVEDENDDEEDELEVGR